MWTRLRPVAGDGRSAGAARCARRRSCCCRAAPRRSGPASRRRAATTPSLGSRARLVAEHLAAHGASFFDEIADAVRLLPAELEDALAELVVRGRVNCDSFAGLRALLVPPAKRSSAQARRRRGVNLLGIADAGRWSLIRTAAADSRRGPAQDRRRRARARRAHPAAPLRRRLLAPARARGGVAAAMARAGARLPPARGARRDPRRPLHRRPHRRAVRAARSGRLDARSAAPPGRRRAGLHRRRAIRRTCSAPSCPAPKVARVAGARVVWRDGVPLATSVGGEVEMLAAASAGEARAASEALLQGPAWAPVVRATATA